MMIAILFHTLHEPHRAFFSYRNGFKLDCSGLSKSRAPKVTIIEVNAISCRSFLRFFAVASGALEVINIRNLHQ